MSNQTVWVRCKVTDDNGISHVLIKGHEIALTEDVASSLVAEDKVERIPEPSRAINPPKQPVREERLSRK